MAQKYDKYGNPAGVSKNTLKKGNYTVTPSGDYKITLKAPVKESKVDSRISFSDPRVAASNPARAAEKEANDARKIAEDNARQQLKRDYDNERAALLNAAITGEALFRDERARARNAGTEGAIVTDYSSTPEYQANRAANYDAAANYQTSMAALKAQQAAAAEARAQAEKEQRLNQSEARARIVGADSELARQNLLDDRIRYYKSTGMSQAEAENAALSRPWETMNQDYLKQIGMDAGNGSLYGVGSSNFNPTTGAFNATMGERKQLKQDRADLQSGKYDDLIAQGYFSPSGTGLEAYGAAGNVSQPNIVYGGTNRSLPEPPVQSPSYSAPANATYPGSIPTNVAFTNPGTASQQTANMMNMYSSFGNAGASNYNQPDSQSGSAGSTNRVRKSSTGSQFTSGTSSRRSA